MLLLPKKLAFKSKSGFLVDPPNRYPVVPDLCQFFWWTNSNLQGPMFRSEISSGTHSNKPSEEKMWVNNWPFCQFQPMGYRSNAIPKVRLSMKSFYRQYYIARSFNIPTAIFQRWALNFLNFLLHHYIRPLVGTCIYNEDRSGHGSLQTSNISIPTVQWHIKV